MEPRKPMAGNSERKQPDTIEKDKNPGKHKNKKKGDKVDIDQVVDKEHYTERDHGRTHDSPADISNPGTV